jgi:CheY-like chemotaxis protein
MNLSDEDRAALRDTFWADAARRADRLAAALDALVDPAVAGEALATLADEAHALRGAAATVGVEELEALAADVEEAVRGPARDDHDAARAARELLAALRASPPGRSNLGAIERPGPQGDDRPLVLHIEDDPTSAKFVEHVVAMRQGIELVYAASAGEGMARAAELVPDLILLDMHLPDGRADALVRELRSNPATGAVRVVVLSGATRREEQERLLAAGADAFLAKPVTVKDLLDAIDSGIAASTPQVELRD